MKTSVASGAEAAKQKLERDTASDKDGERKTQKGKEKKHRQKYSKVQILRMKLGEEILSDLRLIRTAR